MNDAQKTGLFCIVYVAAFLVIVTIFAYKLRKRSRSEPTFPLEKLSSARFLARGASMRSRGHWGQANRCVLIVVTDDGEFWTRMPFPFNAFALDFDLDHRVRLADVTDARVTTRLFTDLVYVDFRGRDGELRTLEIRLHRGRGADLMRALRRTTTGEFT
jgi:hypothetical protein